MTVNRERQLGLIRATGIGVGAIVGGGILALAGTTLTATGPSVILAFLANGLIAIITALSFAELSTSFPLSGGTYLFAKRVLSVGTAFSVGWIAWFASIVAAALYAVGFATFFMSGMAALWPDMPVWMQHSMAITSIGILSLVLCTAYLSRFSGTGGHCINVLKVLVFGVLICGGLWVWLRDRPPMLERMTPVFSHGCGGLVRAMGFGFIALQGFDLIAAVAGEVKDPRRVLPRSMLISLIIALGVYIPLLLLICVVGVPANHSLSSMLSKDPDTIVAQAARVFLGPSGFWVVLVAGILSMLSALLANLFAASRIAQAMAGDRALPSALQQLNPRRGTPTVALICTGLIASLVVLLVRDLRRGGAAASLIFLITFALTHVLCLLARKRKPNHEGFRMPWWPVLPGLGFLACTGLALFQAIAVPEAGLIAGIWFTVGFLCYLYFFGQRARIYDAASESADPDLLELRGRSPLVLVPIANPAHAGTMALLGACITPRRVGRILLLNVSRLPDPHEQQDGFETTALILRKSMSAALREHIRIESLATVSNNPWMEIDRVARAHRCASVLLGMTDLADQAVRNRLENLASRLPGNVVIFRAPEHWHPRNLRKILVPIGGRVVHNALRARLLQGLNRRVEGDFLVEYLLILPTKAKDRERRHVEQLWSKLVTDEISTRFQVQVTRSDDVATAILEAAADADLVVLGLNQTNPKRKVFGAITTRVVQNSDTAVMVIGQRG